MKLCSGCYSWIYHVILLNLIVCFSENSVLRFFDIQLCFQLHQLLGISNPTTVDGLSWTLMRSPKHVYKFIDMSKTSTRIKLSNVLGVIHECFEPVNDPHTKRDLVRDVVFNSG